MVNISNLFKIISITLFIITANLNGQVTTTPNIYWNGDGDGVTWHDSNNWNLNRIPNSNDIAGINNGSFVHIYSDATVKELHNYGTVSLENGKLSVGYLLIRGSATFIQKNNTEVIAIEVWCNLKGEGNTYEAQGGKIIFANDDPANGHLGGDTKLHYGNVQFNDVEIMSGSSLDFKFPNSDAGFNQHKWDNTFINISGDFINHQTSPSVEYATFTFNGTGEQKIYSAGGAGSSIFGVLLWDKSSGEKLKLLSNIDAFTEIKDISTTPPTPINDSNFDIYFDLNESDSEGPFAVSVGGAPLPVKLREFTFEIVSNRVNLFWSTETEINNYGFEVERSQDEFKWFSIGFVEGNGNSNSPKEYSYYDVTAGAGTYFYRLKQIDNDGATEYFGPIKAELSELKGIMLKQNYPNPFNPLTTIRFGLSKNDNVKLTVYNILGKEIATLFDGNVIANKIYKVNFDADELSSGTYFYQIRTSNSVEVKKMNLVK